MSNQCGSLSRTIARSLCRAPRRGQLPARSDRALPCEQAARAASAWGLATGAKAAPSSFHDETLFAALGRIVRSRRLGTAFAQGLLGQPTVPVAGLTPEGIHNDPTTRHQQRHEPVP